MPYSLYAMDTAFYHSLGAYDFDVRCEMLAELGYNATYLTLWSEPAWEDLPLLANVKAKHGLDVAGVYVTLDIARPEEDAANARILYLLDTLEGCTLVELAVKSSDRTLPNSDTAGDAKFIGWLSTLLKVAQERGLTLALYPHINHWLERLEDGVRLCRLLPHPHLGLVFPCFHWYAVDGNNLATRLAEAAPWLRSVNLCGSRKGDNRMGMPATIEPLDEGELDLFAVLGLLRAVDYRGPVGVQGYGVGGDVYAKLKRSLTTFRDMERRLEAHPRWAKIRLRHTL